MPARNRMRIVRGNGLAVRAVTDAYCLVGPTASGKTDVAHCLAETLGAWILSADAMQVYRGLDIGTAKAEPAERLRFHYGGVDLVDPNRPFDLSAFLDHAAAFARVCREAGRPLLVVGGSGLYVRALLEGLAPRPPADPVRRREWERRAAEEGVEALQSALRAYNPAALAALADPLNPRRLVRALESAAAGVPIPARTWLPPERQPVLAGLRRGHAARNSAIVMRVDAMYRKGLLEEARGLREHYGPLSRTAGQAIGYAEAFACLDGRCGRDEAIAQTAGRTRRLAKRQLTWFRRQANVQWVDADNGVDAAVEAVRALWDRTGPARLAV
jgi:tRNA dimethylallyltransferase